MTSEEILNRLAEKLSEPPKVPSGCMDADRFLKWLGGGRRKEWLLRRARAGQIPALKIGGEWFFHPETVMKKCSNK